MTGTDALRDALADPSITIEGLSDDDAGRLAAMIDATRARQREQLKAAIDGGLNHLPRLVRGPVKKLLF